MGQGVNNKPDNSTRPNINDGIIVDSNNLNVTDESRVLYLNNNQRYNLSIGLNYQGTSSQLNGCENDATHINNLLANYFSYTEYDRVFYSELISSGKDIDTFFDDFMKQASSGDRLFFSYSGHGTRVNDTSGDETDGIDEVLVGKNLSYIKDDVLHNSILSSLSLNTVLLALVDSCHSGTALDLVYRYVSGNSMEVVSNRAPLDSRKVVIMISGSTSDNLSYESVIDGQSRGALSWAFENVSKNEDISLYTWKTLIARLRSVLSNAGYPQVPQLSTNVPNILNEFVLI